MDTLNALLAYLPTALTVLGAATVFLGVISKLTDTKLDDKLLGLLTKLHDLVALLVPGATSAEVKRVGKAVVKAGADVVFRGE
jgi:hypothetical protein